MNRLTEARRRVLRRCATEHGINPVGPDWAAIYWLRAVERQYVEKRLVRGARGAMERYVATAAGRLALSEKPEEQGR